MQPPLEDAQTVAAHARPLSVERKFKGVTRKACVVNSRREKRRVACEVKAFGGIQEAIHSFRKIGTPVNRCKPQPRRRNLSGMKSTSCYAQAVPQRTELMFDNVAADDFFALVMHHQHTVSSEMSPLGGSVNRVRHNGHPECAHGDEYAHGDMDLDSLHGVHLQGLGIHDLAAGVSAENTTCRKDADPSPNSMMDLTSWETFIHAAESPVSPALIPVS